jgi:hypothetical protein
VIEELSYCKGIVRLIGGEKSAKTLRKNEGVIIDQDIPVVIQIGMFKKINEFGGKFFVGISSTPRKKASIWISGMP